MSIRQEKGEKTAEQVKVEQYLSFIMDSEEYAVGILSVREIRGWESVTPIPNTPDYVKGFINLRGIVVPIIDLRQRFNLEVVEYTDTTVVIILNTTAQIDCQNLVGIIVDAVSEVYDIAPDTIRSAPNLGSQIDTQFIKGIVEINDKMIILTEVQTLLDTEELFSND
ncbi:MAG: purine-binding chemotaxis protein CheW [Gammaproteobacteria bacterium]|nr:purine-binding chemotaxis protein CheW [Gammaproteobacteria bacterium]